MHIIERLRWSLLKPSLHIGFNKENNKEGVTFKVGDPVRISKYKNIPNWSKIFVIEKKLRNTLPWAYVISDLRSEEIVGTFYEKELQQAKQKESRIEKVKKRKGNKLNGKTMIILLAVGFIKKTV